MEVTYKGYLKLTAVAVFSMICFNHAVGQIQNAKLKITQLTGDFYVFTTYGSYKGNAIPANSMYLVTNEGVVMFDTPWDSTQCQPLLDSIKAKHGKDVIMCIATHFHDDRTIGLDFLKSRGIMTYTTKQTDDLAEIHGAKRAKILIYRDTLFNVGQYSFQTIYDGPGHSPDNIVIWFEKEKILYGGCLVKSVEATDIGNISDANMNEWAPTIRKIQRQCKDPKFVIPGHLDWTNNTSLEHTLMLIRQAKIKSRRQLFPANPIGFSQIGR